MVVSGCLVPKRPRQSLESDVAAPIPEVNISTVAGSSVGSSAPVGPNLAAPIPEVNISTVVGSSVGSSTLVLGPPGLLESGTDLVEVGLVMRDLLCSVFQLAQEHQFALLSSW